MEKSLIAGNQVDSMQDDASLVEAARREPAAFSALYHRYVIPVYRYLYKRLGNPKDAEDLTSQVFMDALEGLLHYKESGNFAAWLFTIARRRVIAAYRRQRPVLSLDEVENTYGTTEDPLEQLARKEQLERMGAILAELKDDQRELLRLRFTAELSYAEIGDLLGRSEAAVKMAVHRLLRDMSKKWKVK